MGGMLGKKTMAKPEAKPEVQRTPGEFNLAWAATTVTKYWDKLVSGIVLPVTAMAGTLAKLVVKDQGLGEIAYAFAVTAVEAREAFMSAKRKSPENSDAWPVAAWLVVKGAWGAHFVYHENVGSLPEKDRPNGSDGKPADKQGNIVKWPFDRTTMVKAILETASTDDNPLEVDNESVVKQLLAAIEYAGSVWAVEHNLTMPRQRIRKGKGGTARPVQLTFTSGVKGQAGERPNFAFSLPNHVDGLFSLVKPAGAAKLAEGLAHRIATSSDKDGMRRLLALADGLLPMLSDDALAAHGAAVIAESERRADEPKAKGQKAA